MNSSKPFKVFSVIITYNGAHWIHKCLGSLRQSGYPVQVIVVDNCSTDQTVSLVRQNFPEYTLIENTTNEGFGKANNQGISLALMRGADYFFLLNQDAWVEKDTIEKLLQAAREYPQYGIISPLHYTGSGVALDYPFEQYLKRSFAQDQILKLLAEQAHFIHEVQFINAAAWLISLKCITDVGGFGSLFYHYGEDRDYIQRLKYLGYRLGIVSGIRIFHDRESRFLSPSPERYSTLVGYYFTSCLARCADINSSLFSSYLKSLLWCFKESALFFFTKRRFILPFSFFHVFGKLTMKLPAMHRYRATISSGTKFLFLDPGEGFVKRN